MAHTILIHIMDGEPFLVDVEKLPDPTDTCILGMNPRLRDGREVGFILPEVTTVVYPWHRISFIEVMPTGEEEEIVTFVRD
ncbi:MAG: hypothetical protein M5R40_18590 [Anaerolineae bacterium]|nr:hypothetical protein [Anaerolineae bacterium]